MEQMNAKFRLIGYRFPTFSFDATKYHSNEEGLSLNLSFAPRGEYDSEKRIFRVVIEIQILTNEEAFGRISCEADYEFEKDLEGSIPDYFYANSIAIIYPYIRAFCSLITTQSNNTGIILPVLNLTSLGEKLKEKTTVKHDDTEDFAVSGCSLQ